MRGDREVQGMMLRVVEGRETKHDLATGYKVKLGGVGGEFQG